MLLTLPFLHKHLKSDNFGSDARGGLICDELKCPRNCKYTAYLYLNHYVTWVEWSPRPTINMDSTYIGCKQRSTFTLAVKFWCKKHTECFVETMQWTCPFMKKTLRFLNLGEWQHAMYLQKAYMLVYFRLTQCHSFPSLTEGIFQSPGTRGDPNDSYLPRTLRFSTIRFPQALLEHRKQMTSLYL